MKDDGLYLVENGEQIPLHTAGGTKDLPTLHEYLDGYGITSAQQVQRRTHTWRMQKWPDLDPLTQLAGTDVEVSELLEMEVKGKHYDEAWADDEQFKEEIGDVIVYLMGYASLKGFDIEECIDAALDKNNERDWEEHMEAPQ